MSDGGVLVLLLVQPRASAQEWTGAVAGGAEPNVSPALTGHGWVFFDTVGKGVAGNADVHMFWNTTKVHIAIERLSFAKGKLAFFAFAEGELLLSQLLRDYFKRGKRIAELGFNASYTLLNTKLQWYPGKNQTLEIVLSGRHWWFGTNSKTSSTYVLPPNTWVFEPRIGYVYWNVDAPSKEWEADRIHRARARRPRRRGRLQRRDP